MFKKKPRTRTVMLTLIVAMLASTAVWRIYNAQQQASLSIRPMAVTIVAVRRIPKPNTLQLSGTVEGLTSAIISSRFAGKIDRVLVEDGQAVPEGAALLTLDTIELANAVRIAQNNVRQAEANFNTARADYQRYDSLFAKNAVTKQQLESAQARMITNRTEVDNAYANLDNAQKQITDGSILSPVAGVVANKAATIGQVVSPGTALMTVEQIDRVYVVVNVGQEDIAAAKPGAGATVAVDAYPARLFEGAVAVINPVAGSESRMFRVKIKVDNSGQLLKPGMFARATLATGEPQAVLAVPRTAIMVQKGLHYVYVAVNGQAEKTLITTGALIGDLLEVKTGLKPGMSVVIDNLDKIKDGDALLTEGGNNP
ncbi:efflux RND transporter periplasmic adaptor subunit [Propionispora hippei]|uniref:RND family efflux transporter, MFP subunit n=1 Tax=Propionispora hippei DSM 15287 TaxID=1123003 RepID=A0A1M6NFT7_9FIRM|nr:efflux RND transporter periplasmic adaptor subunit [Propionispora hippei]SHJ94621.1 RND family efflux transporter, MFP subunit [Propionispora hippei DSM 15287]